MKLRKLSKVQWLDIISNPFVMALPIALVIIVFLPDIFDKYEIKLVSEGIAHKPGSYEEYYDLNTKFLKEFNSRKK